MVEIRYPYPNWEYIQPLVQQWFDNETMPVLRGQRYITAVIGENEPIDMTGSGMFKASIPGPTTFYAVDQTDHKHEIPAYYMQQILDMASLKEAADSTKTVACMWCGEEKEPSIIEEHEALCGG